MLIYSLVESEDASDLPKLRGSVRMCQAHAATLQDVDEQIERAIEGADEGEHDLSQNIQEATDYQIAPFDGSPLKWEEFWDAFDSTIHSDSDLSVVEKFQYLKEFLKSDALLLAEGYRMTEANYGTVVDMLKQRFGNKEVAIQAHFDALMSLAPATGEVSQVQRVFDECEVHIRSLVALDLDEATFGRVFAPIVKSKLPEHVRLELERRHDGTPWTLHSLRQLLRNELHALRMSKQVIGQFSKNGTEDQSDHDYYDDENEDNSGRSTDSERPLGTASCFVATDGGSRSKKPFIPCAFCNEMGHFPGECEKCPDVDARKQALKGGCFLCLRRSHHEEHCKTPPKRCVHCQAYGKNHRSLCPEEFGKSSCEQALNISADEFVPQAYSLIGTTSAAQARRGQAVMQTAIATVKGAKSEEKVRLLFDPASRRSFGRTDVLRRIGAKQVGKETLAVAGLGSEKRSTAEYGISELVLILNDGSEFALTVNGVKSISCPVQKHALKSRIAPVLSQIELADPAVDRPEMVQVDILIGLDYYSLVGVEQCRMGALVILDTKVGYIASGCLSATTSDDEKLPQDTVMMLSVQDVTDCDDYFSNKHESLWNTDSSGYHSEKYEQVATRFSKFENDTTTVDATNPPLEATPLDRRNIDDDSTATSGEFRHVSGPKLRPKVAKTAKERSTLLAYKPSEIYSSMFGASIRAVVTFLLFFSAITGFQSMNLQLSNIVCFGSYGPLYQYYPSPRYLDTPPSQPKLREKLTPTPRRHGRVSCRRMPDNPPPTRPDRGSYHTWRMDRMATDQGWNGTFPAPQCRIIHPKVLEDSMKPKL